MNTSTHEITLDVSNSGRIKQVFAKQGDKGTRYIEATIISSNADVLIESGATAKLRVLKPDNTVAQQSAMIDLTTNSITAEISESMLLLDGKVLADIALYGSNNEVLSTEPFYILVEKSPFN